jgi:hypothetical protein
MPCGWWLVLATGATVELARPRPLPILAMRLTIPVVLWVAPDQGPHTRHRTGFTFFFSFCWRFLLRCCFSSHRSPHSLSACDEKVEDVSAMITELPLNPSADELEVSEPMEEAVVANEPEAVADSDVWVEVRFWLLTDVR